jgi:transposase
MPNFHAPYPPAFKDEAVRLVLSGDKSIAAIALDLGVSDPTLRSWVRQAEIDAGTRDGLTTSERIELAQLRREVRVLKQERDILKSAMSWSDNHDNENGGRDTQRTVVPEVASLPVL